ncbi:MAG: GNAT family N-acetyltransferase [Archangium sp.]
MTRFRSARPTNDLAALERFYVEGAGLNVNARFAEHDGFSGIIVGSGTWEMEFVAEAAVVAPRAPTHEHLLVLYLNAGEVDVRAARLDSLGFKRVAPNNPWWSEHGVTFEDPDGYHFVLARESAAPKQLKPVTSTVVVRAATPSDEGALRALHAEAWTSATTPTEGPPTTRENRDTFVATLDGVIVGAVELGPRTAFKSNAHVGVLAWLAVSSSARRQGVGAALSAHVIAAARARGMKKLALNVLAINTGAVTLYESLGFELEARRVREFFLEGRYVDGLEYSLAL